MSGGKPIRTQWLPPSSVRHHVSTKPGAESLIPIIPADTVANCTSTSRSLEPAGSAIAPHVVPPSLVAKTWGKARLAPYAIDTVTKACAASTTSNTSLVPRYGQRGESAEQRGPAG